MFFFVFVGVLMLVVFVLPNLGHPGTWPRINRWSLAMYAGITASAILELFAATQVSRFAEPDYALGLATNIAIARRNELLCHQAVISSLVAISSFVISISIYRLKVRRTAA